MGEADTDLWRKCTAGDADAFGVLFDRHTDVVFRYSPSRCGSWHDAEELVSITFLEAWRQRNRLRPEGDTVLPWPLGVATNANRHRASGSRRHADFLAPNSVFPPWKITCTLSTRRSATGEGRINFWRGLECGAVSVADWRLQVPVGRREPHEHRPGNAGNVRRQGSSSGG